MMLEDARIEVMSYDNGSMPSRLFKQVWEYCQGQVFTDVTIVASGEAFQCHRLMLASSSAYFQALFIHEKEKAAQDSIELPDISSLGFGCLLEYMYTAHLEISTENVIDVLEAADFLQFREIVELCTEFLLQHVTIENCLGLEQIGSSHLCQALSDEARAIILNSFEDVIQQQHFVDLHPDTLMMLLTHPKLIVSDGCSVLSHLCRWIAHSAERLPFIDKIIAAFSVATTVSKEEIYSLSRKYSFLDVNDDASGHEILEEKLNDLSLNNGMRRQQGIVVVPRKVSKREALSGKIYVYDHTTDSWNELTKLPFEEASLFSVNEVNNVLMICGGELHDVPVDNVWTYTHWEEDGIWERSPDMLKARSNHGSASLHGNLYVLGGKGLGDEYHPLRNDGEEYNTQTKQWTLLPALIDVHGLGRCACTPLGECLYVMGGTQTILKQTQSTSKREVVKRQYTGAQFYNTRTQSWTKCDTLSGFLNAQSVSVGTGDCLAYRGFLLIIDEDQRGKRLKLYNPITKELKPFIRSHGGHRFGGYVLVKDVLYCTGGVASWGSGQHDLVHYQDLTLPKSSWMMAAPLPCALSHHAGVTLVGSFPPKHNENASLKRDMPSATRL